MNAYSSAIKFVNTDASDNYAALTAQYLGVSGDQINEYHIEKGVAAAIYVLGSICNCARVRPFVKKNSIDFDKILKLTSAWGTGLSVMARLAAHLFNPYAAGRDVTPHEIFRPLDENNTRITLEALRIAYSQQI